jgi:hypothetical protein
MSGTRFYIIFISLFGILSTSRGQSDSYSAAMRSFSEGSYFQASVEFEKVIFYSSDNVRIAQCKYYKALCYKEMNELKRALDELEAVNISKVPDSLFFLIRYEQTYCNLLSDEPEKAFWNINDLNSRFGDSLYFKERIPLEILCLNELRKWGEAVSLLNVYIDRMPVADSIKSKERFVVSELYRKKNLPKHKSSDKAENLSRFIPGSGQIYSGKVFEGSFNFLMNATLLGFSLYEFYTRCYFTGYVAGLTLFNKTYHGGMHRAAILAEEKNRKSMNEFNIKVSDQILDLIDVKY